MTATLNQQLVDDVVNILCRVDSIDVEGYTAASAKEIARPQVTELVKEVVKVVCGENADVHWKYRRAVASLFNTLIANNAEYDEANDRNTVEDAYQVIEWLRLGNGYKIGG